MNRGFVTTSLDRSRVALVVPALNEASTISSVVAAAQQYGQIIVVDDASTDGTGKIANQAGALVIRNRINLQYEGALEVGLRTALTQDYDYVVTVDADGQHDPSDIPKVIAALHEGADLVIGIRPEPARIAERWFGFVGRRLWGIEDPLCGLKGYRLSWLRRYTIFDTYRSIGTELSIRMIQDGARFHQLPISILGRRQQPRFGGRLKANWRIAQAMVTSVRIFAKRRRLAPPN